MGIRIFAVTASLTIVAAMAIALGIYFKVIPVPMSLLGMFARTAQPEFSARYYPPDTVAYTWVTLMPRGRQMRYMRETWDRFNEYPGFVSAVDDWKFGFAEETGISFDLDITTWIGPTMSAGLLDIDADTAGPTLAAVIGVRDEGAAAGFLDKWIDYISAKVGADFEKGAYRDNRVWISGVGDQAYALTGDWLVYATNEDTLRAIVDRIDGSSDGSLARTDKFRRAREALPVHRFASAYLDHERGADVLAEWSDGPGSITPLILGSATGLEEPTGWVASAATWVDRGLVTEWVTPSARADALDVADLEDPAALLPENTLGFVAARFDPDVGRWRMAWSKRQLSDVLPAPGQFEGLGGMLPGGLSAEGAELGPESSLAGALDQWLDLAHETTGIDLEPEFFDHLAGTAILAIRDFDFAAVREDPAGNPVEVVAMLSYKEGSRENLDGTMSRLAGLAQTHAGLSANAVEVGGEGPATVFDLGPLGMMMGEEIGYRPGYVLHDQYLTVGTTEQALATVVGLQNGQGDSLALDAEYRRATQYLPISRQLVAYVEAHRIVDRLGAEDLRLETAEYEVVRDGIGVFVLGLDDGENYRRGTAVITLFPE